MTEPHKIEHRLVTIDPNVAPRFRPSDIRVVQAISKRSLVAMVGDDTDDAGRMRALAFFGLRRAEPDAAAKDLWELADEADLEMVEVTVDPTNGATPTPSPLSVASGG